MSVLEWGTCLEIKEILLYFRCLEERAGVKYNALLVRKPVVPMKISAVYHWTFLSEKGKKITGKVSTLSNSVSTTFAVRKTS